MNNASVNATECLADATCLQLIDVVLEMANISPEAALSDRLFNRLSRIANEDPGLQQWLDSQRVCAPTRTVDSEHDGGSVRNLFLMQRLPELLAAQSEKITCDDQIICNSLHNAAHLSARARATSASLSKELRDRQNESIYHFAYGLSHELNNPLANIATRAGVLAQTETDKARRELFDSIVDSAMRGCEMLGDLMLVARPPMLRFELVAADEFFPDLLHQARRWATPYDVTITEQIDLVGSLNIDVVAMREALWCLLRNSIEAIFESGEIDLTVARSADDRIKITIRDNGPQLTQLALKHCFDPFFSGREAGRGLGLGLTKAQRIIGLHQGDLKLANLAGGGCLATVLLPS